MRLIDVRALITVANPLDQLGVKYAFTGGSVLGLLLDNPQLAIVRPTEDVDAIVEVVTWIQYTKIEERLRGLGFRHDTSDGAPLCRWRFENILVDIMPAYDTSGHFSDRWFQLALDTSTLIELEERSIRVVSAPCFIATKLTAFDDRGNSDFVASHDLEDIVTVVDGRAALGEEVEQSEEGLRKFLKEKFRLLLEQSAFIAALPGHLPPDEASQRRLQIILNRLYRIAGA